MEREAGGEEQADGGEARAKRDTLHRSEIEFQSELDLPRRAERARHAARGRGVDRGAGRVEARRVREVEDLHAEFQLLAEALEQREVEVLVAVLAQDVRPAVAVRELRGQ